MFEKNVIFEHQKFESYVVAVFPHLAPVAAILIIQLTLKFNFRAAAFGRGWMSLPRCLIINSACFTDID
ncbi:Uncharacterised protein [Yersinia enterocolitica]|nr:Uncharacterised protein [Yersinia mollaretii]CNK78842.1 Uncharacterised protein [Yersinia mollaretii]CNL03322.1 Uncharacterised protein [Yersinia enterocolitica]